MGKNKGIVTVLILILILPFVLGFKMDNVVKSDTIGIEGKTIILKYLSNEYSILLGELCVISLSNQGMRVNEEALMKKINELAEIINKDPVDVKILDYKAFTIAKEEDGIVVDGAILSQMIRDYITTGVFREAYIIEIPVMLEKAKITESMLKEKISEQSEAEASTKQEGIELASFTTSYNPKDRNRTENLRLSTKALNDLKISPGEVFSMDKALGERTEKKGYKYAPAFSGGEVVKSLAGGICQTTTTMYNAALFANLKIVERYKHGLPVSYINKGRDATIYSKVYDLKVKNIYDFPIKINAYIDNKKGVLTVKLIGLKKQYNVKIFTEHKIIKNKNYYYTYRQVYDTNNALIRKELISTDIFNHR
jgi:vancomycin resistance protein YoaR